MIPLDTYVESIPINIIYDIILDVYYMWVLQQKWM